MKLKDLVPDVWSSKTELKPLDMFSASDTAKAVKDTKPKAKTVTVRNTSTGEIIGKRTIMSK